MEDANQRAVGVEMNGRRLGRGEMGAGHAEYPRNGAVTGFPQSTSAGGVEQRRLSKGILWQRLPQPGVASPTPTSATG